MLSYCYCLTLAARRRKWYNRIPARISLPGDPYSRRDRQNGGFTIMKMNACCEQCLLEKNLDSHPEGATPAQIERYRQMIRRLIPGHPDCCAPQVDRLIRDAYREVYGVAEDYTGVNRRFNRLMLTLEPELQKAAEAADDPLLRGIQYAMAGNFIDFAVLTDVSEDQLRGMLAEADGIPVDPAVLEALRACVRRGRRLVFFTDNSGEIVADKVLIRMLKRENPSLHVTVMVRGGPVANDATMEDAVQVRMDEVADAVMGSGSNVAGNVMALMSDEALAAVRAADVLLAKGQGNYESLEGCGLNAFYVFMCKCQMFVDRFRVPRFSGMLIREAPKDPA